MENQPTKQKKLPKLTKKRKGFVEDYVVTGNATEAVVRNYDVKDREVAKSVGSELLTFPNVAQAIEIKQESLKSALEKQGITPEYIAKKVDVLLTAVDEKGKTDYTAVDKGLKHATNIYGVVDESEKPKQGNTTYNFIFSPDVQDRVKAINEEIKNKLINAKTTE